MTGGRRRIADRFAALAAAGRAGMVPFITAGDPDLETSTEILLRLPGAGADMIELGMPFSDPMADGPAIQRSSGRAIAAGQTMARTFAMVRRFREADRATPLVLMGYFNPIHSYGAATFARDAAAAGADGLIVVDLPPEEEAELGGPAREAGLAVVRLVAPTTGAARLPQVLDGAEGFAYYVSITGITGTKSADRDRVARGVARIRAATALPVAVGFGVRRPDQAARIAEVADAVVVGSALVERIAAGLDGAGAADGPVALVRELAAAVRAPAGTPG